MILVCLEITRESAFIERRTTVLLIGITHLMSPAFQSLGIIIIQSFSNIWFRSTWDQIKKYCMRILYNPNVRIDLTISSFVVELRKFFKYFKTRYKISKNVLLFLWDSVTYNYWVINHRSQFCLRDLSHWLF